VHLATHQQETATVLKSALKYGAIVAGGTSSYPTWSYLLNVGAIAGSYLMYLPASPFGRRSFVARAVDRFARSGALAPGMA